MFVQKKLTAIKSFSRKPNNKKHIVLGVALLVFSITGAIYLAFSNAASPIPIFTRICAESHVAADDPIVYPGLPGGAHMHDFSGAWSTNAYSTYESLRASTSTCESQDDTASYWTPSIYNASDGTRVKKLSTYAYYVPGQKKI